MDLIRRLKECKREIKDRETEEQNEKHSKGVEI